MLDLLLSGDFNTFIKEFLTAYGYYAILILTFLEGETIVLLAGAVAATTGALHPGLVILCAFIGSCTSDQIMFCIGKYFGPRVLKKFPRLNTNVDRASRLIKKYDILLILGFRFVYGVRNITPIMLGISHVPHFKFSSLNIIGALVWASSFTAGGYYAAKGFGKIRDTFGTGALYTIIFILVVTGLILYIRYRQNKKKAFELAEKGRKAIQAKQLCDESENKADQEPQVAIIMKNSVSDPHDEGMTDNHTTDNDVRSSTNQVSPAQTSTNQADTNSKATEGNPMSSSHDSPGKGK